MKCLLKVGPEYKMPAWILYRIIKYTLKGMCRITRGRHFFIKNTCNWENSENNKQTCGWIEEQTEQTDIWMDDGKNISRQKDGLMDGQMDRGMDG